MRRVFGISNKSMLIYNVISVFSNVLVYYAITSICKINCDSDIPLDREKRYVYFPYGGSYKLVIGIGIPIMLPPHQSLIFAQNVQFQYPQITNLSQVQQDLPPIISRRRRSFRGKSEWTLTYMAFEALMDKYGVDGKICLLRAICENAMFSLHHDANGMYGQLLHIFLTPNYGGTHEETDIGIEYFDAQEAGKFGVDCLTLYPECPLGHGFLDYISMLDND